MAEPTAGITPATSFGEREPPASRAKSREKARAKGAPSSPATDALSPADPPEADETEKHQLDTMA